MWVRDEEGVALVVVGLVDGHRCERAGVFMRRRGRGKGRGGHATESIYALVGDQSLGGTSEASTNSPGSLMVRLSDKNICFRTASLVLV